jgi:uncharacterized protein (TIGR03083 family)
VTLEPRAYLEALRLESERFGRAARGPLDACVPSCPEWSLGDLVWHLGGVQWFWSEIVRTQATDREGIEQPLDLPDDELPSWFDDVSARLVDALEAADASMRVWSWAGGQQDVAWVMRRQAHEAAVHRWDAQRSIGEPEPISSALAADGIGEFFDWMFGPEDVQRSEGSVTVQLSPIDGEATWVVSVRDGHIDLAGDAAAIDATARASTSDLLLLLWRRVGPGDVQVEGDRSALERFLALVDLS